MAKNGPWPKTDPPWDPVEAFWISSLKEAGCADQDVEALRWAIPGRPRKRLAHFLMDWHRHGPRVMETLVGVIESVPRVAWARTVLVEILPRYLSPDVLASVRPSSLKAFILAVPIVRPDLARRIRGKGEVGPGFATALRRSGWSPLRADALAGSQAFLNFESSNP